MKINPYKGSSKPISNKETPQASEPSSKNDKIKKVRKEALKTEAKGSTTLKSLIGTHKLRLFCSGFLSPLCAVGHCQNLVYDITLSTPKMIIRLF